MKKIDLTYQMRRATRKTVTNVQVEATRLHSQRLLAMMQKVDTLKKEVLNAMANYVGGTMEDAENMFALAEFLRDNPTCEVTDVQLALIEQAIANASVEVRVTWKAMYNELN